MISDDFCKLAANLIIFVDLWKSWVDDFDDFHLDDFDDFEVSL